jgi:uncharacterized membrane protein YvbJ
MVDCGNCGKENPPDARFCNSCGKELTPPAMGVSVCRSCGAQNAADMRYCGQCRAALDSTTVVTSTPVKAAVEAKSPTSVLPKRDC